MRLYPGLQRAAPALATALLFALSLSGSAESAFGDASRATGNIVTDLVQPREADLLEKMKDIATRSSDDTLRVQLTGGESRSYRDSDPECDDFSNCWSYHLFQYDPRQDVVVLWLQLWEGNDAILVHRAGGETLHLEQAPYSNPTSPFWALVDWDEAYGGAAIQLIENRDGALEIAAESASPGMCHFDRWTAESTFAIFCYQNSGATEFTVSPARDRKLSITSTGKTISSDEFERRFRFPE